tara:strand:+ start:1306 stop:2121 length:816 start_codon:yes stop_codon:yes gene_type:complete
MSQDKKYLIFAHYHSKGLVRKDIIEFLNESKKYFTKIVLVSTKINLREFQKISKKVKVIKRKNTGYDFYSYKVGWEYIEKLTYYNFDSKKLYFINSSILFTNPKKILAKIKKIYVKKNEFWGLSRSFELTDHIQSYFFFFSASLFKNRDIFNWWKKIKPLNIHYKVILKYELGLSKLMIKNNIQLKSIYKKNINLKTNNIFKKIPQRFNEIFLKTPKYYKKDPTHYFWQDFYRLFGVVKIRLIKDNDKKYKLEKLYKILKKRNILKDAINN